MAPRKVRVLERYNKLGVPTKARKLGGELHGRRFARPHRSAVRLQRAVMKPSKFGESYKPGTVLVVLSGGFVGKRVLFLKHLSPGLLLVAGLFWFKKVALGRVKQAYVHVTSTRHDISHISIEDFNDPYSANEAIKKCVETEKQLSHLLSVPTLFDGGAEVIKRIPVAVPRRSKAEPAPEDKDDDDSDDDDEDDEDEEDNVDEDDDGGEEDASGDEGEEDPDDPEANGEGGSDDDDDDDEDEDDDEDGDEDGDEDEDDEEDDEEEIPQPSAKRRK